MSICVMSRTRTTMSSRCALMLALLMVVACLPICHANILISKRLYEQKAWIVQQNLQEHYEELVDDGTSQRVTDCYKASAYDCPVAKQLFSNRDGKVVAYYNETDVLHHLTMAVINCEEKYPIKDLATFARLNTKSFSKRQSVHSTKTKQTTQAQLKHSERPESPYQLETLALGTAYRWFRRRPIHLRRISERISNERYCMSGDHICCILEGVSGKDYCFTYLCRGLTSRCG